MPPPHPTPWQVRLTLLPALLEEAYGHLQAVLCTSALHRGLFVLPFHRDVRPSAELLAAMRSALLFCQQVGGWRGLAAGAWVGALGGGWWQHQLTSPFTADCAPLPSTPPFRPHRSPAACC